MANCAAIVANFKENFNFQAYKTPVNLPTPRQSDLKVVISRNGSRGALVGLCRLGGWLLRGAAREAFPGVCGASGCSHRAAHDEEALPVSRELPQVGESGGGPSFHIAQHHRLAPARSLTAPCPCQTLADQGGAADLSSGVTGTIPVEFFHGNESIKTMAFAGQELSAVRAIRWPTLRPSRAHAISRDLAGCGAIGPVHQVPVQEGPVRHV